MAHDLVSSALMTWVPLTVWARKRPLSAPASPLNVVIAAFCRDREAMNSSRVSELNRSPRASVPTSVPRCWDASSLAWARALRARESPVSRGSSFAWLISSCRRSSEATRSVYFAGWPPLRMTAMVSSRVETCRASSTARTPYSESIFPRSSRTFVTAVSTALRWSASAAFCWRAVWYQTVLSRSSPSSRLRSRR